jgi:dTDP-4-dehydrorhamnose reductase
VKILLTGKTGQVGRELSVLLPRIGDVFAPNRHELDLAKPGEIRKLIRVVRPQLIVNAAAYTAVDQAESDRAMAQAINGDAPQIIAEEGNKIGACLVHYSTDYVFDGKKDAPYVEEDPPNPQNAYGATKLMGERAIQESGIPHLIFRIAWVYAREGRNFLLTVLRLAAERDELKIVCDQKGAPTWSREVAQTTIQILSRACSAKNSLSFSGISGTYHMSAGGETTWDGFAAAILEDVRNAAPSAPWIAAATGGRPIIARSVLPITTAEYVQAARRPAYSVLSNVRLTRTFGTTMPHWRTQLQSLFLEHSAGISHQK